MGRRQAETYLGEAMLASAILDRLEVTHGFARRFKRELNERSFTLLACPIASAALRKSQLFAAPRRA